jgi:hypothetical protein
VALHLFSNLKCTYRYHDEFETHLSKAILTGLFCGIATTITCLVFTIIYRSIAGFYRTIYVHVPLRIFSCNVLLLKIGAIYFEIKKYIPHVTLVFVTVFVLLTLFCLWKAAAIPVVKFTRLLTGIIIIVGVYADIPLPFF